MPMKYTPTIRNSGFNPDWVSPSQYSPNLELVANLLPRHVLAQLDELKADAPTYDDPLEFAMNERIAKRIVEAQLAQVVRYKDKEGKDVVKTVLPDYVLSAMKAAFKEAKRPEDVLSCTVSIIESGKRIEQWKATKRKERYAYRNCREHTTKVDGLWQDAQVCELPPLIKADKLSHEPASYIITLPSGKRIMTHKDNKLYSSPSQALQGIARLQGINMRGGDIACLRAIVKRDDIVPSYMSVWAFNRWNVFVGWQRVDESPSSYWLDKFGKLTKAPVEGEAPLNMSQLLYNILADTSSVEVTDDDDQIIGHITDEDEYDWSMHGVLRERETDTIKRDQFAEDDDEVFLLSHLSELLNIEHLTMGDLQSDAAEQVLMDEIEEAYADYMRLGTPQSLSEVERQARIEANIRRCTKSLETLKMVNEFIDPRRYDQYFKDDERSHMYRMASDRVWIQPVPTLELGTIDQYYGPWLPKEPVSTSSISIINEIKPINTDRPLRRTQRLKRGTVGMVATGRGLYKVRIPQKRVVTTPENANETLKRVLVRIKYGMPLTPKALRA